MHPTRILAALVLTSAVAAAGMAQEAARLLRYPDIHRDQVVFTWGGDLWLAPAAGGDARRLTSHEGLEQFPKFSPDGRSIAFTGEYSGTTQVHVISVEGGEPRQLTYYNDVGPLPPRGGVDNRVHGWSPDGQNVLFGAHRLPWGERMERHYIVPLAGGMERPLEIPEGSAGEYSPDGNSIVYTPISREFRTWKRYRGGRNQDVWIYDLANSSARAIVESRATDNQPVWIENTIYYTSDREDGKLNLWAHDLETGRDRKVTNHTDWDVLWPSGGSEAVVYEAAGRIWRFDHRSGESREIPINIVGDFQRRLPYFANVRDNISSATLSPSGARALFTARGEIFSVPAEKGEIRNVTQTSGVREMNGSWSPDGRWIAYLSDRTGEYEVWVRPADGTGSERRVTSDGTVWRFEPVWSPDSRSLAFSDKDSKLWTLDLASGRTSEIDRGTFSDITWYRWSPDSRWLTYTKTGPTRLSQIWVQELGGGAPRALTSGENNDTRPVFDPKGRYLYFLSDRDFNLTFSDFEFSFVYTNPTRVYVGVLAADGPALLLPQSDEERVEDPAAATANAQRDRGQEPETEKPRVTVRIDPDFENRVRAIPGSPGSYRALSAIDNGPMYLVGAGGESSLRFYDIEERKEKTVLTGAQSYDLSANREKVLFRSGPNWGIAPVREGQTPTTGPLDLSRMEMQIDPRAEWSQEFVDAWRALRDFFYDPNMHGLDWVAIRDRYATLVPHIAHRSDLDYILGELGGELNAGHVYVTSPATGPQRRPGGLLGAEIVADSSGYYRIENIFPGENWHEDFRSPLTEPGVRVNEGDYILAVDGVSTRGVDNFYRLMQNKARRVVALTVNSRPDMTGARTENVRPIEIETNLRYLEWVQSRREMVERLSGGRIGYIHIPNTAVEGNRELYRGFYRQAATKEALIIDDRYNGGGFIPDRMIELVSRPVLNYWDTRNDEPTVTPGFQHQGPKAVLINGYSSSGGDAFPYYFRKLGLGPLIGTRTWGGLIGINFTPSLADGGSVTAPSFRFFDTEGSWAVENEGVSPDIEVVDHPALVAQGRDPSLETGVQVLLEELRKNPPQPVVAPPPPDASMPPQ